MFEIGDKVKAKFWVEDIEDEWGNLIPIKKFVEEIGTIVEFWNVKNYGHRKVTLVLDNTDGQYGGNNGDEIVISTSMLNKEVQ